MVSTFKSLALVGALMMVASPAFAEKMLKTQVGDFDLDPFNVLAPAAAPAPATPAAAPAKKHHKKKSKKKM